MDRAPIHAIVLHTHIIPKLTAFTPRLVHIDMATLELQFDTQDGIKLHYSQRALQQPSGSELGFVQAEVMAELVDVGDAHLFVKGRQVFSAVIPELSEEERDGRRLKAIGIGRFVEGRTAEKPHRIVRHALLKPMLGHFPFAEDGGRPRV